MAEPTDASLILQGNTFKPLASFASSRPAAADDVGNDVVAPSKTTDEHADAASPSDITMAGAPVEDEDNDVESQQQQSDENAIPSSEKRPLAAVVTGPNVGIFAGDGDDAASVFSFDSLEKRPRIPLRVHDVIRKQQENQGLRSGVGGANHPDDSVPFPSIVCVSMECGNNVPNVCPCRCLFFTLKEAVCLVMSALGCAAFLMGLVLLCMFLEGSIFNNS